MQLIEDFERENVTLSGGINIMSKRHCIITDSKKICSVLSVYDLIDLILKPWMMVRYNIFVSSLLPHAEACSRKPLNFFIWIIFYKNKDNMIKYHDETEVQWSKTIYALTVQLGHPRSTMMHRIIKI